MKFYLKNNLKDGEKSLFLSLSLGADKVQSKSGNEYIKSKRFRWYTGVRIHPKYWDKKNQEVRIHAKDAALTNKHLEKIKTKIKSLALESKLSQETYTVNFLRNQFTNLDQDEKLSMMESMDQYIENHRRVLSTGTLKIFSTLRDHLKEFKKDFQPGLDFDKVDSIFLNEFKTFLWEEKDNTDNTVVKNIEKLKTFLHWATANHHNTKEDFKKFAVTRQDKSIVFLSEEELKKVEDADFSQNERLMKIQDVFLFGCYTGLRYSDLLNLKPENITSEKTKDGNTEHYISIVMYKVKIPLKIPISNQALNIIKKYANSSTANSALPVISNQMYNKYLKEVCEAAKLNEPFVRTRFRGNEKIDVASEKWEVVSSHSARHAYAILSLERGMKVEVLQQLLGHTDIEQTMEYVKITDRVKAGAVDQFWNKNKTNERKQNRSKRIISRA